MPDQADARAEDARREARVVVAQARIQQPIRMEHELVLHIHAHAIVGAMVVQVTDVRRRIEIAHCITVVALQLGAHDQCVALDAARHQLQFRAVPRGIEHIAVDAGRGRVVCVIAQRRIPPPEQPGRHVGRVVHGVLPGAVEHVPRIDGARARVVEALVVRGRRHALGAIDVAERHPELAETALGEQTLGAVEIHAAGHTVAHARLVELGKVEVTAGGVVHAGRQQPLGAVLGPLAPRHAGVARIGAARRCTGLYAVNVTAALGDDVDHAKQRVRSVHRRARSGHVLDALDQVDVEDGFGADGRLVEDRVVGAMAVDQQQEAGVVIARTQKAARPQRVVAAIVVGVEAGQAAEDVGQGAPAIGFDVRRGDDRNVGRRLIGGLCVLGCARDDLHLHELLDGQRSEVGHIGLCERARGKQRTRHRKHLRDSLRLGQRARQVPTQGA